MAYSYENELQSLKEAQKKSAISDLENTRNKSLSDLQAEQQKNIANYNTQRNTANVQNQLGAKNFQEYLAATGRANSGLASQAKLQNDNNLHTNLNAITNNQNAALADINRRITDTNNAYNTGLAGANANIEANYIQNLLNQRAKAEELALEEKKYNESVRQFNEQMAYNYTNLRGGRGSSSSGGGSEDEIIWSDGSNGYFSNGYQPNNVNGSALHKSGKTVGQIFDTSTTPVSGGQNIWKADNGRYYVWVGNGNQGGTYVDVTSKYNQSVKNKANVFWK